MDRCRHGSAAGCGIRQALVDRAGRPGRRPAGRSGARASARSRICRRSRPARRRRAIRHPARENAAMNREAGYSVLELLVASAVMLIVCGAVLGLLHDGLAGTPILEETTDLQQRARVAGDSLAAELRAAAAGTPAGPLSRHFAAVDPRRVEDPPGSV